MSAGGDHSSHAASATWRGPRRLLLAALLLSTVFVVANTARRLNTSFSLARQAHALSQQPAQPRLRLLVVGDSTAVGTGASRPAQSLVGLIAADHPDWQIHNLAANGARFADVLQQLQRAPAGYDQVLVLAGGNDVMRLTGMDTLRLQLEQVVVLARQRAGRVVLMPCGNVGHAPFFFPPVSWLMGRRSRQLHALVAGLAQRTGSVYVRLLQPAATDPFVAQPDLLNAADGLHPSDAGYRQWYAELRAQGGLPA